MGIIKSIGKGIGYFFLFPLLILAITLWAIVGFFVFLYQLFKSIWLFFSGRNLFSDLPEDEEVKRIKSMNAPKEEEEADEEETDSLASNVVYGSGYSSPYGNQEEPKEETEDDNL